MSRSFRLFALAIAALVLVPLGAGTGAPPERDDEEREERLAMGKMAFRDNCLMCHAEEMTSGLRLTEKQWMAEIDKMIGWGAPLPPELKGPLYEYLVSAFSGSAAPVPPPERMTFHAAIETIRPEGPAPPGDPSKGGPLYASQCATCHGPTGRGGDLGTALVERTVLLRPTEFAEVVRKGRRRMPGFVAAIKPEQEADILAWLRTQRFGLE